MGYLLSKDGFDRILAELSRYYRLYGPVRKQGEGRFTDTDVIRYDLLKSPEDLELEHKSDYSFKETLLPLSETLFYFTEEQAKEADHTERGTIVFLRSCDLHAVKRLDQMYLANGSSQDPFYRRMREHMWFVLIGYQESDEDCFCVDMGSNVSENGYIFSVDRTQDGYRCDVQAEALQALFRSTAKREEEVVPAHVTENPTRVDLPEDISLDLYQDNLWEEYSTRCIGCGRCNFVCPTCTCYTMQDIYYTDNGQAGERRRVTASCMIDGYTDVAGGGSYRKTKGERMRFKVLHKIHDFRKRFGYDMCVGCGRCDAICPEYISFPLLINKISAAAGKEASHE